MNKYGASLSINSWVLLLAACGVVLTFGRAQFDSTSPEAGQFKRVSIALASMEVVDEHGARVEGLFEGMNSLAPPAKPRRERYNSSCGDPRRDSKWKSIAAAVFGTVHAASCPPDECAGSYIRFETRICNNSWPGCSSDTHRWHYTDVMYGWENSGWRYSGAWNCNPCENCEEQTCTTP